jgi:hypothetical protein
MVLSLPDAATTVAAAGVMLALFFGAYTAVNGLTARTSHTLTRHPWIARNPTSMDITKQAIKIHE